MDEVNFQLQPANVVVRFTDLDWQHLKTYYAPRSIANKLTPDTDIPLIRQTEEIRTFVGDCGDKGTSSWSDCAGYKNIPCRSPSLVDAFNQCEDG